MTEIARSGSKGSVPFRHRDFDSFFREYARPVPIPLAVERAIECEIYTAYPFERPVLDLGCGDGIFAKLLFAEPIDTGVDPDERELQIAKELRAYSEVIACSGDSIPKPDGHYRTIFSNSVLEHIPDVAPVIRELHRLLHPGGELYVTIPTDRFEHFTLGNLVLRRLGLRRAAEWWQSVFKRFWNLYNVNTVTTWTSLFEEAGFHVEESFQYETPRLTLLKEFLMPFSVPGALAKRVANRWTFSPRRLRGLFTLPGIWIIRAAMRRERRGPDGCLIFMRLRKENA